MVTPITQPIEKFHFFSSYLARDVRFDFYYPRVGQPVTVDIETSLLLINDGQNMEEMGLAAILQDFAIREPHQKILCVAIHCGPDRLNEYGVGGVPDFKGRGDRAYLYTEFIINELIPFVSKQTGVLKFKSQSFAGFSLGGLSALDIVLNYPGEFLNVGVFSGSLWWRSKDLGEGYDDDQHRIIHQKVRQLSFYPWLKFFFETGVLDETADRNNNGIIDSIDDTLDLIKELERKGYKRGSNIQYLELRDGKHDVETWARAMPEFLKWCWGNRN